MGQQEAIQSRRERDRDKMRRFRDLARELEACAHELEGDSGAASVHRAAEELRQQAAAITRRLER